MAIGVKVLERPIGQTSYVRATLKGMALTLKHLLDPDKADVPVLRGGAPVAAWALSFPSSTSTRTVSNSKYMGNSVLWGELNGWVD